jgi:DNA-binding IclR family transcriptional regulator
VAESAQTLDRGVRVLFALADAARGRTVAELAAELELARPVVYRLLATLEPYGLVRRGPDGSYRIGLAVFDLARRVQPLLREAALPVLRGLAERVGATAHLTVADGGEALAVAVAEPSWTDLHVAYRVGSRHPLTQGAGGRAILLGRDGGDEGGSRDDGGGAATGWATSAGELQPGAHGVAAPVRDVPGLEASVGVVALAPLRPEEVGPLVLAAAARVGELLR